MLEFTALYSYVNRKNKKYEREVEVVSCISLNNSDVFINCYLLSISDCCTENISYSLNGFGLGSVYSKRFSF